MDNEIRNKTDPQPTGRRYASVKELLKAEGVSSEVEAGIQKLSEDTRVTRALAAMRAKAGITQDEMGKMLGCTQGAISKLESGSDEDLTLKEIRDYTKALNERLGLVFGTPMNHIEAINAHAQGMKERMIALAKLAGKDAEMEESIQAAFGQVLAKVIEVLALSMSELPDKGNGIVVQMLSASQPKPCSAISKTSARKLAMA